MFDILALALAALLALGAGTSTSLGTGTQGTDGPGAPVSSPAEPPQDMPDTRSTIIDVG